MNYLIAILAGLCGILFGIVCLKSKKIDSLKSEAETAKDTAEVAEKKIEEVKSVQEKLRQIETETTPPEEIPSADSGDSQSRLDRLNKLFNNQS